MKKIILLTFIAIGFSSLTNAQDNECYFDKRKFAGNCSVKEEYKCDFKVSSDPRYFESHLGTCQCLLSDQKETFFTKHRKLQLHKESLDVDSKEITNIDAEIKSLCTPAKPIEVTVNGELTLSIFHYNEEMKACINTFVANRNGVVGDRQRFMFPGAYNWSLKTYTYDLGDQYGEVKIDENLIDLNVARNVGMNCSGTYEQIIDRKKNLEKRKSFADKERENKVIKNQQETQQDKNIIIE